MKQRIVPEQLPQHVFPVHPWRFVEAEFDRDLLPLTETLFNSGNGYLGLRGDHDEGRDAHDPGTFVNGFHETWSIHHAEEAFGFATTGQTIVNVPDAKIVSLSVDDEPFDLAIADLDDYTRVLDMRRGTVHRELVWRTAAGKAVRVRSERLVSLVHRHIAAITFEVTMLRGSAPVVLASRVVNRQDAEFDARGGEFTESVGTETPERDPRRHRTFNHRVLQPRLHTADDRQITLGYQCTNSKMSLACAVRHQVVSPAMFDVDVEVSANEGATIVASQLEVGQSLRVTKFISYHTSRYSPRLGPEVVDDAFELATRCSRSLDRVEHEGFDALVAAQEAWLDEFWANSDVEIKGWSDRPVGTAPADQQAMRWSLYQLAQASAQTGEQGIAAKGVSGGGYEGHYFWDTEMYIAPFLVVHPAGGGSSGAAVPLADAADRPAAGAGAQPDRGAVPVAHDQRRGGVGVLRGGHRAVPHQRRHRTGPQAIRRRQRRHRVHRRRRRRDPHRDGAPVGRPRVLLDSQREWAQRQARQREQRRADVPHPRRHRPGRVHGHGQRQPVHERDGAVQPALRGQGARAARRLRPRRVRGGRSTGRPARRRGRGMDQGRRADVPAVRLRARHPPAGLRLPRP